MFEARSASCSAHRAADAVAASCRRRCAARPAPGRRPSGSIAISATSTLHAHVSSSGSGSRGGATTMSSKRAPASARASRRGDAPSRRRPRRGAGEEPGARQGEPAPHAALQSWRCGEARDEELDEAGAPSPKGACGSDRRRRSAPAAASKSCSSGTRRPARTSGPTMKAGSKTMPAPRAAASASRSPLFECRLPAHAHRALAARSIAEAPHVARRDVLVREAIVPRQVLRRLRRADAPRGTAARRTARGASRRACARRGSPSPRAPMRIAEVEAFLHQVDDAIGERDVEAHLGDARRGTRRSPARDGARRSSPRW